MSFHLRASGGVLAICAPSVVHVCEVLCPFQPGCLFLCSGFWKFFNIFQILRSGAYLFSRSETDISPLLLGSAFTLQCPGALAAPGPNPRGQSALYFASCARPGESLPGRGCGPPPGFSWALWLLLLRSGLGPLSADDICTRCEQNLKALPLAWFPSARGKRRTLS